MPRVAEGEPVLLVDDEGRSHLVQAAKGVRRERGLGVVDGSAFVGSEHGAHVKVGTRSFLLLPAAPVDVVRGMPRLAQIVQPKDAGVLLVECGVAAGSRVVEAGLGSGALTILLAAAVGQTGRVVAYEKRQDFADFALRNLELAGLHDRVDVRMGDVRQAIAERGLDAVLLDVQDPWEALAAAAAALKAGGRVGCYSPLVSQVEATVRKMRELGFRDVATIETLERRWVVGDMGSRPDFDMLGHTGFVTVGRWPGAPAAPPAPEGGP